MNREIKFRAFVRGYITNVVSIDFVNQFITWDDNQYDRCHPPNKCYETESFDTAKLMQWTGLKDKNKVEIYEGDICKWPSGHLSHIAWNGKGCFTAIGITQQYKGVSRSGIVTSHIEVIGNKYEHSHLLNKQP